MIFVLRKLGIALTTVLLAVTVAFLLSRLAGDPVLNLLGPLAPQDQIDAMRSSLGLDKPLLVQYIDTLGALARGDFGESLRYGRPNLELLLSRLPATLSLAGAALALAVILGVPLGVLAAVYRDSPLDRVVSAVAVLGQSIPLYWLGMMLVLVVAIRMELLPAGNAGSWENLVLPAVTLAAAPMASVARLTRSSMVDVLGQPYILSARARGLRPAAVVWSHGVRNAGLPVITLIGLQAGHLLSGVVTVEVIFAWPGLGTLAVNAVGFRDFSLVQAAVIFSAILFVTINLAVDLLYSWIDPRIRSVAQ